MHPVREEDFICCVDPEDKLTLIMDTTALVVLSRQTVRIQNKEDLDRIAQMLLEIYDNLEEKKNDK